MNITESTEDITKVILSKESYNDVTVNIKENEIKLNFISNKENKDSKK